MRFKTLFSAAVAAATTLSLVACGDSGDNSRSADKVKIAVQAGAGNQAGFDQAIAAFEAQSDIDVDIEYVGGDYSSVIRTRLQGGNAPDIVYVVPGGSVPHSVGGLGASGHLADLSGRPWQNALSAEAKPLVSVDGKVYAWPATVQVSGLIVNRALLEKHGLSVPKVFSELLELCADLRSAGVTPMSWAGMPQSRNGSQATTIAAATGAAAPDVAERIAAGKSTFAGSPEWRTVMDMTTRMVDAKCVDADSASTPDTQVNGDMVAGRSAMMISNTQQLGSVLAADKQGVLDLAAYPFPGETADQAGVLMTPYDALAVTAKSTAKEAAMEFIDFLAQPSQQRELAKLLGNLAPVDVADAVVPDTMAALQPYFASKSVFVNPVMNWSKPTMYPALASGVQGLLTGQSSPDSVLAELDKAQDSR